MNPYQSRRQKLVNKLNDHSALILFSGAEVKRSADSFYDFAVNRNFYYLTGIKQENSILIITKIGGKVEEKILTLAYDFLKEVWTGRRLTPEQVREISGIEDCLNTETYDQIVLALKGIIKTVYLDLEPGILTHTGQETKKYGLHLSAVLEFEVLSVYDMITRLRMVKDESEIKLIRESIHLTAEALKNTISKVKPGVYEYELGAAFEYGIKRHHGELGFGTIVASGANGVILHYPHLDAKVRDGDLILFDLGGHNNMYTADISRTVPANGKFAALQKTLYGIVLACNKAVINEIKPGKTLLDLQNFTKDFLKTELVAAQLMNADEDIMKYYYHGVSHHLGLDTHDPGDRSLPLEPGNVITVEPGLYFKQYEIGIRIEDNVLVTARGCENLSIEIPKEIKDITF
jgi:Xaa-Pro aminopeptidase